MNNFEKLKVQKPKQGGLDRRSARQRPWTMMEYAVSKTKGSSAQEERGRVAKKKKQEERTGESVAAQPTPPPSQDIASAKVGLSSYYTKQDNDFYELAASELTPSEERLYQRMFRMSWGYQKNTCRVSVLDLAQMIKTDPRQIRRIREGLIEKGWIQVLSSRLEAITSKKPLEYRIFAAREILARRNQQSAAADRPSSFVRKTQEQEDYGHVDPGQITRGESAAEMSRENPETEEIIQSNPSINQVNLQAPLDLKKNKEIEKKISPLNPPKGGGEGNVPIPSEVLVQAESLTEEFYARMNWSQQTERIRQSDIASIVHWHYYEGFAFDVIERALKEIASKPDTRSLKRAEFYLAPLSKTAATSTVVTEEKRKKDFDEEVRQKEERITKLERIKQQVPKEDFEELYQSQFDNLQAENPSLPLFVLETLARQKANQELLSKYADE